MEDLTFDKMMEAYKAMASVSPQIQWRMDRSAAAEEDRRKGRGYLIINPELDLGEMDVDGCIVEKDGVEYRVIIDERIRGMRIKDEDGKETDQIHAGFWVAPPPSFDSIIKDITFTGKIEV